MSSSSDLMTEELLCSICLDVLNDPVSTPCGHNFCKTCLKTYWDTNQYFNCPICNERFSQRPDLKINTTLRDLVNEHMKKGHEKQAVVMCDICDEGKLEAVKSCLVCQSSYCQTHLEPHLRVTGLQKHKLIDPVNNLHDYICQKHEKPLELICRDDQTCVCLVCTVTHHKNHNTVPLGESELLEMMEEKQKAAAEPYKDVIKHQKKEISELKKRNFHLELIAERQRSAEERCENIIKGLKREITEMKKRNIELEMTAERQKAAEKQYEDIIKDLEQRNTELKMMEKKQKAAEKWSEDVIKDLKRELTELRIKNIEQEMVVVNQKAAEKRHENLIKYLAQEITELKGRNTEQEMKIVVNQRATEKRFENLMNGLAQENANLRRKNTALEMMEKKQKAAEKQSEDVIKDLKKRNTELEMMEEKQKAAQKQYENLIKYLEQEITELKGRNIEQEMKIVVNQKAEKKWYENLMNGLVQKNANLRRKNTELEMMEKKQKAAGKQSEDVIKDLKKRNTELEMMEKKQKAAEKQSEDIIKNLKKRNTELEMMEKKQKAAEKQSENVIKDLKRRNTELEMKISHTGNKLSMLQETSTKHQQMLKLMFCLVVIGGCVLLGLWMENHNIRQRHEAGRQEISELKKRNFDLELIAERQRSAEGLGLEREITEMKKRNIELEMTAERQKAAEKQSEDVIKDLKRRNTEKIQRRLHLLPEWKWMKQNAVDVTLDPDTAHPNLILSYDQKQVRTGDSTQYYLFYSRRFYNYLNVMANEGFSSGRFYYEVQVKGKTGWVLGVARESVNRKGDFTLAPMNGYWTVSLNGNEYLARAGPDVSLSLSVNPQKVGVFVDYNEGLVSFYDVDSRSHIYSFTGQTFTEKLYPVFNPCDNKAPLIITPVNYNE